MVSMLLLPLFLPFVVCLPSRHQATLHETARDIISASVNSSVDPCDDFYDFACGGWIEKHEIPASGSVSIMSLMQHSVNQNLSVLLSDKEQHPSKVIELVKHFYQSCMDLKAIEANKGKTMIQLVNRTDPHVNFAGLLANANRGVDTMKTSIPSSFFSLALLPPLKISRASKAVVQPEKVLSSHFSNMSTYKETLFEILSAYTSDLGEKVIADSVRRDVDDVVDLEDRAHHALAMAGTSTDEFQTHLDRYLELIVGPEQLPLFNAVESEVGRLGQLFKVLNSTSPRTVKNYFAVYYSMKYSLLLDSRYSPLINAIVPPEKPRWERCLDLTRELTTGQAMSALYVTKDFDPAVKTAVEEMASDIRQTFIEILKENEWMDAEAKEKAVKKAEEMIFHIGYDTSLLSNATLDAYYKGADVSINDSFLEQFQKWQRWASFRKFRYELTPVSRSDFGLGFVYPIDGNPVHTFNTINVPAAFIQQPVYSKALPAALNYGGLGAVIAHEITHGFAKSAFHQDQIENIKNRTWSSNTVEKFVKVEACVVQQFNVTEVPELKTHLNGEFTSEENIADLGGVKAAFRVFQRYIKKHGSGPKVPGAAGTLYSDEQLFFLGHAHSFCSKQSPLYLQKQVHADIHAPERYRINVGLTNEKAFADAFQCASGTSMNPKKQCKIW